MHGTYASLGLSLLLFVTAGGMQTAVTIGDNGSKRLEFLESEVNKMWQETHEDVRRSRERVAEFEKESDQEKSSESKKLRKMLNVLMAEFHHMESDYKKELLSSIKNKNTSVNGIMDEKAMSQLHDLSQEEALLYNTAGISPEFLVRYFADKGAGMSALIADNQHQQTIVLFTGEKSEGAWFNRFANNVNAWFINPGQALERGGYNDSRNAISAKKDTAVLYHTFTHAIDEIAKNYAFRIKQEGRINAFNGRKEDDSTLALIPGLIFRKGTIAYGNFEYVFGRNGACFHRCFSPLFIKEVGAPKNMSNNRDERDKQKALRS